MTRLTSIIALALLTLASTDAAAQRVRLTGKSHVGTSTSRSKVTRNHLFGKRQTLDLHMVLKEKGNRLVTTATTKQDGRTVSATTTGKIVSDKVKPNGDRVLEVKYSGEHYRQQVQAATNSVTRPNKVRIPIKEASARQTVTIKPDGRVHLAGSTVLKRDFIKYAGDSYSLGAKFLNIMFKSVMRSKVETRLFPQN